MSIDPASSQPNYNKTKWNRNARDHQKKCQARVKSHLHASHPSSPLKEVNHSYNDEIDKHDIFILDFIYINIDEEDTLDDPTNNNDDEYDTIDLDNDFANMLSK